MTDDQNRPGERDAPAEVTPPGALLRAARLEANLSEEEVARELRMTVSKVRAVEADDYDRLHSDTFVRGYLRTYAKLLELEPDEILEAYRQTRRAAGLDEEAEESPLQINTPEPSRPLWQFALWILILLVGLWALSVWFLGNQQAPSSEAALNEPITEMTPEGAGAAEPEQSELEEVGADSMSATETAVDTGTAAGREPDTAPGSEVEALASTQVETGQPLLTQPAVLDQLVLTFSDDCWLEVTDARGDILAVDLVLESRTLTLSGEAPFEVKMGNASAVAMELNGEPVAFEAPEGHRTLTLTVN